LQIGTRYFHVHLRVPLLVKKLPPPLENMQEQQLPPELLLHIIEQIDDPAVLCNLRATAKWLQHLVDSDKMSIVWRKLAVSHGLARPDETLTTHKTWQDLYRYAHEMRLSDLVAFVVFSAPPLGAGIGTSMSGGGHATSSSTTTVSGRTRMASGGCRGR
jgi:hypothetical protein